MLKQLQTVFFFQNWFLQLGFFFKQKNDKKSGFRNAIITYSKTYWALPKS